MMKRLLETKVFIILELVLLFFLHVVDLLNQDRFYMPITYWLDYHCPIPHYYDCPGNLLCDYLPCSYIVYGYVGDFILTFLLLYFLFFIFLKVIRAFVTNK